MFWLPVLLTAPQWDTRWTESVSVHFFSLNLYFKPFSPPKVFSGIFAPAPQTSNVVRQPCNLSRSNNLAVYPQYQAVYDPRSLSDAKLSFLCHLFSFTSFCFGDYSRFFSFGLAPPNGIGLGSPASLILYAPVFGSSQSTGFTTLVAFYPPTCLLPPSSY